MSSSGCARLVIELDLAAQPIGGWLTSAETGARPFVGWLDLMAALEHARAAELQANKTAANAQPITTTNPKDHPAEPPG